MPKASLYVAKTTVTRDCVNVLIKVHLIHYLFNSLSQTLTITKGAPHHRSILNAPTKLPQGAESLAQHQKEE